MVEEIQRTMDYLNYLQEHYDNVQKAWKIVQEKCDKASFDFMYDDFKFFTLDNAIKKHDASKLSAEEFVQYRRSFYPIDCESRNDDDVKAGFNAAWDHHKEKNDHHWENWTKRASGNESGDLTIAVVHNVCDWMAMGMKFNDTAREFYEKQKAAGKIEIPNWAEKFMYEIFDCVYGIAEGRKE